MAVAIVCIIWISFSKQIILIDRKFSQVSLLWYTCHKWSISNLKGWVSYEFKHSFLLSHQCLYNGPEVTNILWKVCNSCTAISTVQTKVLPWVGRKKLLGRLICNCLCCILEMLAWCYWYFSDAAIELKLCAEMVILEELKECLSFLP